MSEVEPNLKSKECCVCLEDFPRQMIIPCNTCKYSTCKTCVEKLTITDNTDYNYPYWEDICYWNPVDIINCPMCRQSMVSRIFHKRLQGELRHYAYRYFHETTLNNEIDSACDGLGRCHITYIDKVIEECIKEWKLSQTPLMKKWVFNYLSNPDIVTDYLASIYGDQRCVIQTPSAKLIEDYWIRRANWIRRAKKLVVIRKKPNWYNKSFWGPTDIDHSTN